MRRPNGELSDEAPKTLLKGVGLPARVYVSELQYVTLNLPNPIDGHEAHWDLHGFRLLCGAVFPPSSSNAQH